MVDVEFEISVAGFGEEGLFELLFDVDGAGLVRRDQVDDAVGSDALKDFVGSVAPFKRIDIKAVGFVQDAGGNGASPTEADKNGAMVALGTNVGHHGAVIGGSEHGRRSLRDSADEDSGGEQRSCIGNGVYTVGHEKDEQWSANAKVVVVGHLHNGLVGDNGQQQERGEKRGTG